MGLCVFYDQSLAETKRIDTASMTDDVLFSEWAVSADGSKIAYFDFWKGLNLYDCASGNTTNLIDVSGSNESRLNILTMDALFFEADGKSLIFSAQTDQNQVTSASWGRIGIDGSGLENHILDQNIGTAMAYQNGKLLYGEDSLTFLKSMGYVDVKTGQQHFSTSIEGGQSVAGPAFSQSGNSFAAAKLAQNSVHIKIYSTTDNALIYEQEIQDDNEELFYRMPHIYLFDQCRVGVVCMGGHNDIPLKTVIIQY